MKSPTTTGTGGGSVGYRLILAASEAAVAKVKAVVAASAPVGRDVECAKDMALDNTAGTLPIDLVASAEGTSANHFWGWI